MISQITGNSSPLTNEQVNEVVAQSLPAAEYAGKKVLLILIVVMLDNIDGSTSSIMVVNFEYLKIASCFSRLSSDHVVIAVVTSAARLSFGKSSSRGFVVRQTQLPIPTGLRSSSSKPLRP